MDHVKHYDSLISRAKTRTLTGYTETHHILPRSLGGTDDATNLVVLTAREHFVAHQLLAHIHGGKMWYALWMMSNARRYGSRRYAWIAERFSVSQRGKVLSAETRRKMSEARKGKSPSLATVQAAAKANSALVRTPEHRRKLGEANSRRVYQFTLEGELICDFHSTRAAAESLNVDRQQISRAARGFKRDRTAAGYKWSYESDCFS